MVPAGRLFTLRAEVAELADALASGASGRKVVKVQILSSAPLDSAASRPRSWQAATQAEASALSERSESKGLLLDSAASRPRSWQAAIQAEASAPSERSESKGLVFPSLSMHRRRMPFVYLVHCADQSLYVGSTADVEARVAMHNEGRGGSHTGQRRPVTLVFGEVHETSSASRAANQALE